MLSGDSDASLRELTVRELIPGLGLPRIMNESTFTGKTGDAADSKSELVKKLSSTLPLYNSGFTSANPESRMGAVPGFEP